MSPTRLNPNIVEALSDETVEALVENHEPNARDTFLACVDLFRSSHARAVELLMAVPQISAAFPNGVPLAYALFPQTEPMPVDELAAEKFGGLPDLTHMNWLQERYYARHLADEIAAPSQLNWRNWLKKQFAKRAWTGKSGAASGLSSFRWKSLVSRWPRCGCCHQPMMFLGQLDLTDWGLALHALTGVGIGDDSRSGLGPRRNLGSFAHRKWWYFFMCQDNHFDCPSSDSHVWLQNRHTLPRLGSSVSEEEVRALLQQFYRATVNETVEIPVASRFPLFGETRRRVFEQSQQVELGSQTESAVVGFNPQKVIGYKPGWEFDKGVFTGDRKWRMSEAVDEVVEANPAVFGTPGQFRLFGAPASQQDESRFWTSRGGSMSGAALRMTPLLKFHSDQSDTTCQLYADMIGDFYGSQLYGKADLSCT